ncbi:MAG TPA: carboxypeptidase regulatory-like domain-containing protein [Vicinamibacteria bacterium]|nr:carboxypeptidase regulatory-like domain-containing protein [Vicinamibacteria bacterium]
MGLIVVLAASAAFAQDAGSVRGTVTDTTGAVVPGATVTLTNDATRFARNVVTDAKGEYYFGAVSPSAYTVKVEIPGFKTVERKGLRINQREAAGFDVKLEVGQQSEKVEVTAQREMIQTQTGAREGLITSEQIENLSVVGRSPLELLRILPGAVMPDVSSLQSVGNLTGTANTNQTATFTVNGVRGSNTVVTLDGSRLADFGSNNGVIVVPNNDMVSEVKVQSSNYAAEYGSAGVQVNAITKGGSSEFHGTLYDYLRDYHVQANDASNVIAGVQKPQSEFQYPGGNLSGPILIPGTGFNKNRDKAFFFLGIEIQRQKTDPGSSFAVTPTAGQRNGDFNGTQGGQNLNQPATVNIPSGFPGAGTAAPGNNLAPYIDPFGQMLLNMYPLPNYNDPTNRYNYVFSTLEPQNRWQGTLRLDYNFTENTKMYVRLAQDKEELDKARGVWWDSSSYALPSAIVHSNTGRSISANLTSVLSPTTTNEFLFTFSKLKLDIYHQDPSKVSLSSLGFPNFQGPYGQQVDVAPIQLYSWGQGLGNLWDPVGANLFAYNSSLMFTDTFTKVLNTHALKAGASVERARKDQNFQNNEQMSFSYGSWIPGSTGNDFGDILVGRPAGYGAGTKSIVGDFQFWNIDFFLQDSWKVKKNFTLEYGLRFSKMTNNIDRNNHGAVFIPSAYDPSKGSFVDANKQYVNGLQYAQLGQVPDTLIASRPLYVMPRVNFAWDTRSNGDLIVRGGAGLFYNRPMGNAEYDIIHFPPYAYGISGSAYDSYSNPIGLTYNALATVDPLSRVGTQSITSSVNPDSIHYPRYFNGSLSVAKRLPLQNILEVGYVGTFGRHLLDLRKINVIPEGDLLQGQLGNADLSVPVNRVALDTAALTTQRPFPALGNIQYWEYNATSNYHSLQATLSRQTSGRFQYFLTYTFSKALGIYANEYNLVDPFDPRGRSYGILPYDRTHVFNASWNWMAPDVIKGEGKSVAKGILNGWQLSGIFNYSSGTPMYISFNQGDLSGSGIGQAWVGTPDTSNTKTGNAAAVQPEFTCNPNLGGTGVGQKILNINCVGIPTYPNNGPYEQPYYMRSPSRNTTDLTVFKNWGLGGSKKLQFRAGFFNIFNQSFATYNLGFTDIDTNLNTTCNVKRDHVPNGVGGYTNGVCDPIGGFSYTQNTLDNFGKIDLKRGHRIIEFALKFYF